MGQEWPRGDTSKGRAFNQAFKEAGLTIVTGTAEGMAMAFTPSARLGEHQVVDYMCDTQAVMKECLERSRAKGDLDAKEQKGMLGTTARKVLTVKFPTAS